MKDLKLVVSALLLFAVLAGIGYALTPPPPPPPPVSQVIGLNDTSIDKLVTTPIDQSACRQCHQTSGTSISGGYSNTIGGVPTRHHSLLPAGTINPLTNAPFGCQDCHPSTPGVGMGILLDRSCVDCHNGTNFWADSSLGAHVGNISRPHHVDTSSDTANIGNPAAARQCNFCHGSFVANYNDSHYKPTYATDFMITPWATFKITNSTQPDGLGGNKVWGGCESCHLPATVGTIRVGSNHDNHHNEILGNSSGTTFQKLATPFTSIPAGSRACIVCHVINSTPGAPHGGVNTFNYTNPFNGELLVSALELRNSTIENAEAVEFVSVNGNISVNGTGCEKCHSVQSIHNIQIPGAPSGAQGFGHVGNNLDCYGCHNSWLPADTMATGAIIPTLDSITPAVISSGKATTLTLTGGNFVNGVYTSVVTVDRVSYTPTSITDSQIVVNIPALSAGIHQVQIVKGGDTLSKLSTLIAVSDLSVTSVKVAGKNVITITGKGFGTKPTSNAQLYVSVKDASGNQITSSTISSWSNTQIKATNSAAVKGRTVTVMTANAGEVTATIS
jgi:hypothetical protein